MRNPQPRFIPACAGNTITGGVYVSVLSVHPRVCGEHQHAGLAPDRRVRFIPACAGNTTSGVAKKASRTVHPRVCGEHVMRAAVFPHHVGSSPRVRGTHGQDVRVLAAIRFIPACAGNTSTSTARAGSGPVHPRVCGEHHPGYRLVKCNRGSSPRVRGTRWGAWRSARAPRFIPACAGNTALSAACRRAWTVHPRVCGEHITTQVTVTDAAGSSPRVRGTRANRSSCRRRGRFIPACAGNTPPKCSEAP